MYIVDYKEKVCIKCKYRVFNSFHNTLYCCHDPLPEGLNDMGIICRSGVCEYWEEYDLC